MYDKNGKTPANWLKTLDELSDGTDESNQGVRSLCSQKAGCGVNVIPYYLQPSAKRSIYRALVFGKAWPRHTWFYLEICTNTAKKRRIVMLTDIRCYPDI